MVKFFIIFILVLSIGNICLSASEGSDGDSWHKYRYGNIVFRLPNDWEEIALENIRKFNRDNFKHKGVGVYHKYLCGFRLKKSDGVIFALPYILVENQVLDKPIRQADLRKLRTLEKGIKRQAKQVKYASQHWLFSLEMATPYYDKKNNIIWLQSNMQLQNGDRLHFVNAKKITSTGILQVHCYAKQDDFSKYQPVFSKIITGIELPPALQYKPTVLDFLPVTPRVAFILTMFAALFIYIRIMAIRNRQKRRMVQKFSGFKMDSTVLHDKD